MVNTLLLTYFVGRGKRSALCDLGAALEILEAALCRYSWLLLVSWFALRYSTGDQNSLLKL